LEIYHYLWRRAGNLDHHQLCRPVLDTLRPVSLHTSEPHSVLPRGDTGAYIAATIFVERDSQKGIVIGEGGKTLKKIGSAARKEIESMGGRKVFLQLRVKVLKDWRNNDSYLRRFGYNPKK